MSMTDMEWGFKAHEKGMNLEMAREEYRKLTRCVALGCEGDSSSDEDPLCSDCRAHEDQVANLCEHEFVELTDDDGQLVEPATDVCIHCGETR